VASLSMDFGNVVDPDEWRVIPGEFAGHVGPEARRSGKGLRMAIHVLKDRHGEKGRPFTENKIERSGS